MDILFLLIFLINIISQKCESISVYNMKSFGKLEVCFLNEKDHIQFFLKDKQLAFGSFDLQTGNLIYINKTKESLLHKIFNPRKI
jgi:hypothetical protein